MSWRLQRVAPREHLCTGDDGDAIKKIHSTAVVWWYERMCKNEGAQSIPYVEVVFRFLDKFDQLSGVTVAKIGVGRMGSFRLGTIWEGGKCIAETDLGRDQEFSVDFTRGAWTHMSITGRHQCKFFREDYELRRSSSADVLSDLLNFPLPDGQNLLVPCVEFLYRCYGSTSDMARVLTAYSWSEVLEKLYDDLEHEPKTRLIQPKPYIPDSDAPFLAAVQYDPYSTVAARSIHAQLDVAHGNGMATSLKVIPWFQGTAQIRARGRWINNGNTFLCLEVTGMSQPQHAPYDLRRERRSEKDADKGKPIVDLRRETVEIPKAEDPFPITDEEEPGRGAPTWTRRDPTFAILGPKCPHTRSYKERTYSERRTVSIPEGKATRGSTGDPGGPKNEINHVVHHARRVEGDGGILKAMWEELVSLKSTTPSFTSLAWYSSSERRFVESSVFRLHGLAPFEAHTKVSDAVRKWMFYRQNSTKVRGILLARAIINGHIFYLFEHQRKKKRKKDVYEEEKVSGLLVNVDDPLIARVTVSHICDRVRHELGRFGHLKIDSPHKVFRHYTHGNNFAADLTVRKAFEHFGIVFPAK